MPLEPTVFLLNKKLSPCEFCVIRYFTAKNGYVCIVFKNKCGESFNEYS